MHTPSIKINALLNATRQLCTVILPLITIPYVSRVLGPEFYGKVNFGSSFIGYFSLLAAFGVGIYAVREGARLRHEKAQLQKFSNEVFTINLIFTLISYLLLIITVCLWGKLDSYRELLFVQSSIIIFAALGTDWMNVIFEDYLYTTIRYVVVQFICLLLIFAFVRTSKDYLIYALILSFAKFAGDIVNIFYIRKKYFQICITLKINFKKHFVPMLYMFGNMLASTIYVYSDITILTLYQGNDVTGVYSIAVKIYTVVKMLINAVVAVAFPRASVYLGNQDELAHQSLLNQMLHALLVLILPAMVGLFCLADKAIVIVGGAEYLYGTTSLRILSVAVLFAVVSYFFVYLVMIPLKLEKDCLIITVISAIINVSLNFYFIPKYSLNGAAFTTLLSEISVVVMSLIALRGKNKVKMPIKSIIPTILGCIGIAVVCYGARFMHMGLFLETGFTVLLSCIVYIIILVVFKETLVMSIRSKIISKWRRC